MIKIRQSNFELLRIVAMLLILLYHANTFIFGWGYKEELINNPYGMMLKLLWDSLCCVGVNVFVMISGWFGIKPTLKGVVSLLFQVYFYCILIIGIAVCVGIPIQMKWIFKMFFFGSAYWFVTEYLVLYIFSPVLNNFIENTSQKKIRRVLIGFYILEICLGWMIQFSGFGGGYYAIHFFGLYLLLRYIRLYSDKIKNMPKKCYIIIYLLCSIIPAILGFYGRLYMSSDFGQVHYSSPFVIIASLAIVLLFSQFKFKSKFINWFACSSFAIYLIHVNPILLPYYKNLQQNVLIATSSQVFYYLLASIVISTVIGILSVCIDKFRLLLWGWICYNFLDKVFDRHENRWQ